MSIVLSKVAEPYAEAFLDLAKSNNSLKIQEKSLHEMMSNVATSDAANQLRELRIKMRKLKLMRTFSKKFTQKKHQKILLISNLKSKKILRSSLLINPIKSF